MDIDATSRRSHDTAGYSPDDNKSEAVLRAASHGSLVSDNPSPDVTVRAPFGRRRSAPFLPIAWPMIGGAKRLEGRITVAL